MTHHSPDTPESFAYFAQPALPLVHLIKHHKIEGEPITSYDALLRTITETDPDTLTDAVNEALAIRSFSLTKEELIAKLDYFEWRKIDATVRELEQFGEAVDECWQEVSRALRASNEVPSAEQLDRLMDADSKIAQAKETIDQNKARIARPKSDEFHQQVEELYKQQPMALAEQVVAMRKEFSRKSRLLGTFASFLVFGIGAGGGIATQDVSPETIVATTAVSGTIGGFTGYLIKSSPTSVGRSAQRAARRRLK